jgi:hypothetical protein
MSSEVKRQCEGCRNKIATKSYISGDSRRWFCGSCYVKRLKGKISAVPLDRNVENDARSV